VKKIFVTGGIGFIGLTLAKELKKVQNLIIWSNKIVFSYPIWWGTAPALLKLFLETDTYLNISACFMGKFERGLIFL
jgi:multimeric flavodoxin WrbA